MGKVREGGTGSLEELSLSAVFKSEAGETRRSGHVTSYGITSVQSWPDLRGRHTEHAERMVRVKSKRIKNKGK